MQSVNGKNIGPTTYLMIRRLGDAGVPMSGKLHRRIGSLLYKLGIPDHWKGYEYAVQAIAIYIYYTVRERDIMISEIYQMVAERYGVYANSVSGLIKKAYMATFEKYLPLQIEVFEYGTFPKLAQPLSIQQFVKSVGNYILQDKDLK